MKNSDIYKLVQYFTRQGDVILLDSQSSEHTWSRKSYLAALPQAKIKAWDNRIEVFNGEEKEVKRKNPWRALQTFRKVHNDWIFGYIGYDLKNYVEELTSNNSDKLEAPDLYFMRPAFLLEFDRLSGKTELLKGQMPDSQRVNEIYDDCSEDFVLEDFKPTTSKSEYIDRIEEAQHNIKEGDFYEITLTHQMQGRFSGNPFGLYRKMKESGPVPFAAFMQIDALTVCCQSPERFLRKEGKTVFSQPIKGTSERGNNREQDRVLKKRLSSSQKEQAENLMIVDLVRNDLSRIAQAGSVEVPNLFAIETFETVHQMVSTVRARTEVEDPIEILKACFPMGSMTGAPKISAMKAIEQLENYRRKVYSGAIGYITPDRDFDFNVVIRTAIIRSGLLFYSVGGAITSDSDNLREWNETLLKAQALANVLEGKSPIESE